MADRERDGIDQRESLAIFNKVLGVDDEDPRLLPENNQGDRFQQKKLIQPREVKLYRELMMEANAQLGFFAVPEKYFGSYKHVVK